MDKIFSDRLHAKIGHLLSSIETPNPANGGIDQYIEAHLHANGALFEDALGFLRRYWERTRPWKIDVLGEAHEIILLHLLDESRGLLEHTVGVFHSAYPKQPKKDQKQKVDLHYGVYRSKVREEIAFLQAVRRRELQDEATKWLLGAAVPLTCALLSVWLAGDARSTLKEINAVRREIAEIAHANAITSRLVIDGAGRFGGMPAHKALARQRIRMIEDRLKEFFPNIRAETEAAVKQANDDAKVFWKEYQSLPDAKRHDFLKKYEERYDH